MTINSRIVRAQSLLAQYHLAWAVVQSPVDLLYFTGLKISQGTLLIGKEISYLFLDGRYDELAKSATLPCEVILLRDQKELFTTMRTLCSAESVGIHPAIMTVLTYERLQESGFTLVSVPSYFTSLRRQKSPEEIVAIEKACALCQKGMEFLIEELCPGISEQKMAALLKMFWLEHDAEAFSFEPIVAFGAHTSFPHWRPSSTTLQQNDIVLFDIGVQLDTYQSDMTRTFFVGDKDEELEKCFYIVQGAYEKAFSFAAPGVTPHHVDAVARTYIAEKGYGTYFPHGLGHGLGLEVHEAPRLHPTAMHEAPFDVGDVFTIEPGIYLPGRGGIRLENTIVMEVSGPRSLFSLPLAVPS